MLLLSPFLVNAKNYEGEEISVSFGKESTLNLYYQGYNKFSVEEDNTFYYDGVQYTLTDSDISAKEIFCSYGYDCRHAVEKYFDFYRSHDYREHCTAALQHGRQYCGRSLYR